MKGLVSGLSEAVRDITIEVLLVLIPNFPIIVTVLAVGSVACCISYLLGSDLVVSRPLDFARLVNEEVVCVRGVFDQGETKYAVVELGARLELVELPDGIPELALNCSELKAQGEERSDTFLYFASPGAVPYHRFESPAQYRDIEVVETTRGPAIPYLLTIKSRALT